ncbi:MAG: zinc transporter ZupT [Bacillota bacterium]
MEQYSLPLLLTAIGGLATGLGGLAAMMFTEIKRNTLSVIMGFAAGVMIYISFAELLKEAIATTGFVAANTAFFVGIVSMMLVDFLIPHTYLAEKIMHSGTDKTEGVLDTEVKIEAETSSGDHKEVLSAGLMTAIGIALHNFPEGIIVFVSSLNDIRLGVALTIAIAMHNIPEGFSIGMPLFYATNNKKKTFVYSLTAGLAEPVGALLFLLIFRSFLTDYILQLTLGFVAGIMVFISFDELLPLSFKESDPHDVTMGIITGMLLMFITLIYV